MIELTDLEKRLMSGERMIPELFSPEMQELIRIEFMKKCEEKRSLN